MCDAPVRVVVEFWDITAVHYGGDSPRTSSWEHGRYAVHSRTLPTSGNAPPFDHQPSRGLVWGQDSPGLTARQVLAGTRYAFEWPPSTFRVLLRVYRGRSGEREDPCALVGVATMANSLIEKLRSNGVLENESFCFSSQSKERLQNFL